MTMFTFPCSSYLIAENSPHTETLRDTIDLTPYCKPHQQETSISFCSQLTSCFMWVWFQTVRSLGVVSHAVALIHMRERQLSCSVGADECGWFGGWNNRADRCWYNCAPGTHCLADPPQSHTCCISMPPPPGLFMASQTVRQNR